MMLPIPCKETTVQGGTVVRHEFSLHSGEACTLVIESASPCYDCECCGHGDENGTLSIETLNGTVLCLCKTCLDKMFHRVNSAAQRDD